MHDFGKFNSYQDIAKVFQSGSEAKVCECKGTECSCGGRVRRDASLIATSFMPQICAL